VYQKPVDPSRRSDGLCKTSAPIQKIDCRKRHGYDGREITTTESDQKVRRQSAKWSENVTALHHHSGAPSDGEQ